MDVRNLGTADALVHPADHIAEDALRVVAKLRPDIVFRPVRAHGHRNRQDVVAACFGTTRDFRLTRGDIDLVIMQRMQRRGCRRGHPGAVRAGHRMADLLLQHVRHAVWHGPHALADLRFSGQSAGQPDIDIPVLIGADPGGAFHVGLADHRPGLHRGVDLVAGPV